MGDVRDYMELIDELAAVAPPPIAAGQYILYHVLDAAFTLSACTAAGIVAWWLLGARRTATGRRKM